jgi:hypothetical protein
MEIKKKKCQQPQPTNNRYRSLGTIADKTKQELTFYVFVCFMYLLHFSKYISQMRCKDIKLILYVQTLVDKNDQFGQFLHIFRQFIA